jgi:hypothetical protein
MTVDLLKSTVQVELLESTIDKELLYSEKIYHNRGGEDVYRK